MPDGTRILPVAALPPIILNPPQSVRNRAADTLPRLGRIACVLAALALPALGIAAADTVHRADGTEATQAAALVVPTDGAAAPKPLATARLASLELPQARP